MCDFALERHQMFLWVCFCFFFFFLVTLLAAHGVNCMFSALAVFASVFFSFFHVDC